jgi:hypothetical protein
MAVGSRLQALSRRQRRLGVELSLRASFAFSSSAISSLFLAKPLAPYSPLASGMLFGPRAKATSIAPTKLLCLPPCLFGR